MTISMHREQMSKDLELFGRLYVHAHYVSLGNTIWLFGTPSTNHVSHAYNELKQKCLLLVITKH